MRLYPLMNEEGDIGSASYESVPEPASEPSSVATESIEPSGDGNAPTPADNGAQEPTGDVTKQQSFANRLREEREKAIAEERAKWEQETAAKLSYLEKQARIYGYATVEEYTKAIDEHYERQEIEQKARELGLDPDTYAQKFDPVFKKVSEMEQKLQTYEQQEQRRAQEEKTAQAWSELYAQYPHLVEDAKAWERGESPTFFNADMQKFIDLGYQPVHAFELAHKETLFRAKQQETLAQVLGRDQKQILPSKDQPNNVQFDPANMSTDEILALSQRVQRGERIIL